MDPKTNKIISWVELMKHTKKSDVWVLIDGKVFDVTTYLAEHPGGDDILLLYSGKDGTTKFNQIPGHNEYAISLRDQRYVGSIEQKAPPKEYNDWLAAFWERNKEYTWDQLVARTKELDQWIVLSRHIYNLTQFLKENSDAKPKFTSILKLKPAQDPNLEFLKIDKLTQNALKQEKYKVGYIKQGSLPPIQETSSNNSLIIIFAIIFVIIAYFLKTKILV